MAPSPRKRAPSTFDHTWDETDAAFLDPSALPISKIPRAWERKQETKVAENGKQKKVWRRYPTRSRAAANQNSPEEDEEEERDSRSRPVKKLQHMSPKAMESSAGMRKGRTRAFKATRWDRRKSMLPRKKVTAQQPEVDDMAAEDPYDSGDEAQDTPDADLPEDSVLDVDMLQVEDAPLRPVLLPNGNDRRATFSFSMGRHHEESHIRDIASSPIVHHKTARIPFEPSVEEDATIVQLSESPEKTSPPIMRRQAQDVTCSELPQLSDAEGEVASITETEQEERSDVNNETNVDQLVAEASVEEQAAQEPISTEEEEHSSDELEEIQQVQEGEVNAQPVLEAEVSYPSLPADEPLHAPAATTQDLPEDEDHEMSEITFESVPSRQEDGDGDSEPDSEEELPEEEFTEASLQLDMQKDIEKEKQEGEAGPSAVAEAQPELEASRVATTEDNSPYEVIATPDQEIAELQCHVTTEPPPHKGAIDDIADGLTLGPSTSSSREPTPRKLQSPSPPLAAEPSAEDTTMTVALDDDTAVLKDFLSRAAASKANKAANITRRESLQNRRDSDVIRHALASPRKILEDKDPNSPSKYDNDTTMDLSQTLTLSMPGPSSPSQDLADTEDSKSGRTSRRSSRTRKSRLPAPPTGPSKIAVRRADGGEPIVLKKTDAQELSLVTRANTRKNKQGALAVSLRLLKLASELRPGSASDNTTESIPALTNEKKNVRWDEQLAYFREGTDTMANMLAEAESLATPDELSLPIPTSTPSAKLKSKPTKEKTSSTPKVRRVRGLGTTNGTPGKGLLAPSSLLPDSLQEEKEKAAAQMQTTQPQRLPKPKSSKLKKMPVAPEPTPSFNPSEPKFPVLDVAPAGVEPNKERKSRMASPKKVRLPRPVSANAVSMEGKENTLKSGLGIGISAGTPKKGIPMPSVTMSSGVGAETGLSRRRARKM